MLNNKGIPNRKKAATITALCHYESRKAAYDFGTKLRVTGEGNNKMLTIATMLTDYIMMAWTMTILTMTPKLSEHT